MSIRSIRQQFELDMDPQWIVRIDPLQSVLLERPVGDYIDPKVQENWRCFYRRRAREEMMRDFKNNFTG